eukprot:373707_1
MSYTWNITDPTLITQIKTAKPGTSFKSPVFSLLNLRWLLEVCPNGQNAKSSGTASIFLTLLALSDKVKSIRINRKYTLAELDVLHDSNKTLTHEHMACASWPKVTVKTQDLQKCTQFTFKVDVDLYAVFDKDDNDITNRYLQTEEIKTDSPASSHIPLNTAILDSIVMQIEQMNTKITAMQQKIIKIELQLNEEQKSDETDDRLNKMMNEMKRIKQTMNTLSASNNMDPEQQKVKSWLEKVRLPQYFDNFMNNGIDELSVVALLDKATLKDIGIDVIGHQMKILNHVKQLLSQNVENEGTGDTAYM